MIDGNLAVIQVSKNYRIDKSKIDGNGVIATKTFKKGDFINPAFTDEKTITEFGAHLNHSDTPNAITIKKRKCRLTYALKDINENEEITVDYRVNKDLEQPKSWW